MRRKGKYTEEPWSNENLSHKIGGWWYQKQSKKERNTHTTDEMEGVAEPGQESKRKRQRDQINREGEEERDQKSNKQTKKGE